MRRAPLDRWAAAAVRDGYGAAQRLLVPSDAASWRGATDQFQRQHRGIASYQRGDTLTGGSSGHPITLVKLTWEDGYTRCLQVQETADGHVDIVGAGYQDCAGLPWPSP